MRCLVRCARSAVVTKLVDGGYVNLAEIAALSTSRCGTTLYAPPTTPP